MPALEWTEKYSVGVTEIDTQHKKILNAINELHDDLIQNAAGKSLDKVLNDLVDYAKYHFSCEEKYMKMYGYDLYNEHHLKHESFMSAIKEHMEKASKLASLMSIQRFLRNWLNQHILEEDKKYVSLFQSKGMK